DWALAGHGIMLKSCADISDDLDSGHLERVLPEWQSEPAPIYALTLSGRHRATKVRTFLDAAKARLSFASAIRSRPRG
ncbi:LysR substrate-binding domain-containing protein, partial [Parvibaculum sp.]|uniref:LysR substrate-binding domain-containing protein n=1 Tax=Parvibaculum sp. TaxID=2024848 RepID=UPI0034A082BC